MRSLFLLALIGAFAWPEARGDGLASKESLGRGANHAMITDIDALVSNMTIEDLG